MTRAEMLACLGGRPCDACKLNEEGGCVRWSCVFEEEPDDSENPNKCGEWIKIIPAEVYECSCCKKDVMTHIIDVYDYCPSCGAKMKGCE